MDKWNLKFGFKLLPERRCSHCSCMKVACCVCGGVKPGITFEMQEQEELKKMEYED